LETVIGLTANVTATSRTDGNTSPGFKTAANQSTHLLD
jgi:hypothetical protein